MMNRRHLFLGALFALTLAASVLDLPWQHNDADTQGDSQADASASADGTRTRAAAAPQARASEPAAVQAALQDHATGTARMHHTKANAFAVHSWLPPVVPVKAAPPPPPRAPALPFAYLGKSQDGAAVTVFVSQGTRNHVLHVGDSLPSYRVESITPTDMTFVYLPLNEKQRLTFGSAN